MHKLVLLRHGESTWNKENRFTGWIDVDLSERGMAEGHEAAKVLQEGSGGELTQTGEFLGKLAYASHELLTFGQIDFRSDIYSLGVIFFRLLTKRRPISPELQ